MSIEKFKEEEFWTISEKLKKAGDKNEIESSLLKKDGDKIDESITLKLFAGDYKTKKTIITDKKSSDEIISDLKKPEAGKPKN